MRSLLLDSFICLILSSFFLPTLFGETKPSDWLNWSELPSLPAPIGQDESVGLAAPFVGVHGEALIIEGGANFPETPPWNGGKKIWHDDIFVLEKKENGSYEWYSEVHIKLPRPLAYGVSVTTQEGIICIGGCDANQCFSNVFILKWNPQTKEIEIESLPDLPRPLAFMSGAQLQKKIYLAGGQETVTDATATVVVLSHLKQLAVQIRLWGFTTAQV